MRLPESILQPSHPSYGCDQAWFVFGVINDRGDITRVLIVEAKNTWAVQTLEYISNKDNRVNSYCELMTVGRKCSSIGTRSNRATEVSYVDFILDIVEPARLLENHYISTAFDKSLSDADRDYAQKKLSAMTAREVVSPTSVSAPASTYEPSLLEMEDSPNVAQPPPKERFTQDTQDIQASSIRHRVSAALLDLGFKKPQVQKVLDNINILDSVEETVKSALKQLYAV